MKPSEVLVSEARRPGKPDQLTRLRNLNWEKVQVAGGLFADALEAGELSHDDLVALIQMTSKLLEFVADVREIVHEYDDVPFAS